MSWRQAEAEGALCWQRSPSSPACTQRPAACGQLLQTAGRSDSAQLGWLCFFLLCYFPFPPPLLSPAKRVGKEGRWLELTPRERRCGAPGFSAAQARPCNGFQGAGFLRLFLDILFLDFSWILLDSYRIFLDFFRLLPDNSTAREEAERGGRETRQPKPNSNKWKCWRFAWNWWVANRRKGFPLPPAATWKVSTQRGRGRAVSPWERSSQSPPVGVPQGDTAWPHRHPRYKFYPLLASWGQAWGDVWSWPALGWVFACGGEGTERCTRHPDPRWLSLTAVYKGSAALPFMVVKCQVILLPSP